MLQQERINDFQESLRLAFDGLMRDAWTAMPAIVTDASKLDQNGTVTVEIAIQAMITDASGQKNAVTIRPLVDVPVVFIGGGNMVATFPIAKGDEALIVFASRCVDAWLQSGGVQRPLDPRHHSISDGFAIVGPRSFARVIPNLSTSTAQFRSLDGETYFEVAESGVANVKAPGGCNITGNVTVTGALSVSEDLTVMGKMIGTGDISTEGAVTATDEGTFNGIEVSTHVHGGVQSGGSSTLPPS